MERDERLIQIGWNHLVEIYGEREAYLVSIAEFGREGLEDLGRILEEDNG